MESELLPFEPQNMIKIFFRHEISPVWLHRGCLEMKKTLWIIFILPIAIAFPSEDDEYSGENEASLKPNLAMVEPKITSLEELLRVFKIHDLRSMSSCQSEYASCTIDKDGLFNFVEYIHEIDDYLPRHLAQSPASSFDKVKSKLQNYVASASTIYLVMLIYGLSLTRPEVQRLKAMYTRVNDTFMYDLQNVEKTFDDDSKGKMKELLLEKNLLDSRIDLIVKDTEFGIKTQENEVEEIIEDLEADNYLIAMTKFFKLKNEKIMTKIVEKMENFEILLKFIKMLPSWSNRIIAYKMILKKQNLGYNIFTLEHNFRNMGVNVFSGSLEHTWYYSTFHFKLQQFVEEKVSSIVDLIQTKNPEKYADLINYSSSHVEPFNTHLEELVEKIYAQGLQFTPHYYNEATEAILAFAKDLTQITQSARVYIKLFSLMKSENRIDTRFSLKIASSVKQLSLMEDYHNTPPKVKKEMEILRKKVSPTIESIVWGQVCILALTYYRVFMGLTGNSEFRDKHLDLWEFETTENSGLWKIRQVETGEYLFANRSKIFTGQGDAGEQLNQYWSLEDFPLEDKERFSLRNEALNEYLEENSYNAATTCIDIENAKTKDGKPCGNSIFHLIDSAQCKFYLGKP